MRRRIGSYLFCSICLFLQARAESAEIILQPISSTAAHTINGTEITISPGAQRVLLEFKIRGYAPELLKTYQIKIASSGYSNGGPAPLKAAVVSCPSANSTGTNFCRATFGQTGTGASRCVDVDNGPGITLECEPAWITQTRTDWALAGHNTVSSVDMSTADFRWGGTTDPGDEAIDEGGTYYAGTLVLDVPAAATGTFTLGMIADETFLQNAGQPPNNNIEPLLRTGATIRISVPCTSDAQCDDNTVCTDDFCDTPNQECVNDLMVPAQCWAGMAACLAGPAVAPSHPCHSYDLDDDGFVDLYDVALLMRSF